MVTNRMRVSDGAFQLTLLLGVPIIIAGAWVLSPSGLPGTALAVLVGVYVMGVVWAALSFVEARRRSVARSRRIEASNGATARFVFELPELKLTDAVAAPGSPRAIHVSSSVGECAYGLKAGDSFLVAPNGRMSRPLCQTAIDAVTPLLSDGEGTGDGATGVSCVCPLGGRQVTFAVDRAPLS